MDGGLLDTRRRSLLVLTTWSAAFGFIEGSVVVYLRTIFYPHGFSFPLVSIPPPLYRIEVLREAATLILLCGIAWFAGRSKLRRFLAFAFCFGLWDLVYYLTLKLAVDWPSSLLDWDVLFLIPLPWTGPVLAPALVSLALMTASALLLLEQEETPLRIEARDWVVEALAGMSILAAFFWNVPALARGQEPPSFPWLIFAAGLALGLGWFAWRWGSRPQIPD